jgi:hypothetical protein
LRHLIDVGKRRFRTARTPFGLEEQTGKITACIGEIFPQIFCRHRVVSAKRNVIFVPGFQFIKPLFINNTGIQYCFQRKFGGGVPRAAIIP